MFYCGDSSRAELGNIIELDPLIGTMTRRSLSSRNPVFGHPTGQAFRDDVILKPLFIPYFVFTSPDGQHLGKSSKSQHGEDQWSLGL